LFPLCCGSEVQDLLDLMVETKEIDPKTSKPKKNKGQASGFEELKLNDYDPLDESHRNSNVHSAKSRCFKLIGYPPGFKRNPTVNPINPKASVNNVSTCNSGSSSSATHTHKFWDGFWVGGVDVVGVVPGYIGKLALLCNNLLRSNEPYDEEKGCTRKDDGTMPRSKGKPGSADKSVAVRGSLHLLHVANKTTALFKSETEAQDRGNRTSIEPTSDPVVVKGYGSHHASTSGKSVQDTNVLSNNKNRNILGNIIADDPESIVDEDIVTGSSRRSKLPSRLQDYELGGKVKYGLNSQAMHGPLHFDLKLDFSVLRYLKGALGKGVFYKKGDKFELSAYVLKYEGVLCKVVDSSRIEAAKAVELKG
ncbi:hypothetical protein Tco_1376713, partial [Tanacetum coccineum]